MLSSQTLLTLTKQEEAQTAEERYHSHAKNATPNLKHRQLPTYPGNR
jgi:hypothetical protein